MISIRIINSIFFIVSLFLCFLAPNTYSFTFCSAILIVFMAQNLIFFSQKTYNNLACFEFFFAFSFCLCNFIYPVFYFPIKPEFGTFAFPFNKNIISYSTALAGLAYSSYLLGISHIFSLKKQKNNIKNDFKINSYFIRILFGLSIITYILYIATGGLSHLSSVYAGNADFNEVGLFSYFNNIFTITCLLLAMFTFKIKDKALRNSVLLYLFFAMLFVIFTGSRTIVIGVGLILLVTYGTFIKKIPKILLLMFVGLGSMLMAFIMLFRQEDYSSNDVNQFTSGFDIYLDLIGTNRNLYVLVDFANNNFHAYFVSITGDLLSPIPGSSGIMNFFGLPKDMMGGAFPTFLQFGTGSKFGLGTNMVGEMYFAFGIYGVIIISFLIGWLISKVKNNLNNVYYYVIYFIFVSHAIFYPRAPYLLQPRTLVWAMLIIFLFQLYKKRVFLFGKKLK
ncbi:O-antigen polymerase [Empedobacter falsenii]